MSYGCVNMSRLVVLLESLTQSQYLAGETRSLGLIQWVLGDLHLRRAVSFPAVAGALNFPQMRLSWDLPAPGLGMAGHCKIAPPHGVCRLKVAVHPNHLIRACRCPLRGSLDYRSCQGAQVAASRWQIRIALQSMHPILCVRAFCRC